MWMNSEVQKALQFKNQKYSSFMKSKKSEDYAKRKIDRNNQKWTENDH